MPAGKAVVAVVAVAAGVAAMNQTLVVPLLGTLPTLLGAGVAGTSWVVTAALLSGAVTSPVIGRLGDLYGKKRLVLVVLGLVTAGSLLCAVSSSLTPMVVGRTLQGVGVGLVPLGISLLRDALSASRLSAAVGLTSSAQGIGAAAGIPVAAAVAQFAQWRVLFWVTAAVTAVLGLVMARLVPSTPPRAVGRFDGVGAFGLTAGLTALLLAITYGGDWGWLHTPTLLLVVTGVAVLVLWGAWERRVTSPLVDLATAARRPVLLVNITSVLVGFALYAQILLVPQLLQLPVDTGYGLGLPMVHVGLLMLPPGLAMMAAAAFGAPVSAHRGPRFSLLLGIVLIGIGYVVCLARMDSATWLVIGTVITNGGVGFAFGAIPLLIMAAVPPEETGVANGVNALMRAIGTALSGAVVGAVVAGLSMSYGAATVPQRDAFVLIAVVGLAGAVLAVVTATAVPDGPRRDSPLRTNRKTIS